MCRMGGSEGSNGVQRRRRERERGRGRGRMNEVRVLVRLGS